jgi:hypothetical protein
MSRDIIPRKRVAVPQEEIKAFALATSLAEAARHYGIKEVTVRSMASRGKWMTPDRLRKERRRLDDATVEVRKARGEVAVATVADGLEEHLERSRKTFRTGIATALSRMAEAAGGMDGATALDYSRKLVDASTVAQRVLGIGAEADAGSAQLRVNLLSLSLDSFPVIELDP